MRDYLRLMIVLAVISAVAGGMLALVDSFTKPKIEAYKALSEASAYQGALPDADSFQEEPKIMKEIAKHPEFSYIRVVKSGFAKGKEIGWVCKVVTPGYSSNIVMLVGVNADGKLGKVLVLDQKETPGLGTNVTDPGFIDQPAIARADVNQDLKVTKDGGKVQAITGATISSRAVLRGINQVFNFYRWQVGKGKVAKVDVMTDATNLNP